MNPLAAKAKRRQTTCAIERAHPEFFFHRVALGDQGLVLSQQLNALIHQRSQLSRRYTGDAFFLRAGPRTSASIPTSREFLGSLAADYADFTD